jgi:hypothetical protein
MFLPESLLSEHTVRIVILPSIDAFLTKHRTHFLVEAGSSSETVHGRRNYIEV